MLRLLIVCFTLLALEGQSQTSAQRRTPIKEIRVGDICPDVEINGIINHTSTSAKMSDFKDKLVILDFWATWCSPCIAAFPKLDSIQKKFAGKLQILPVTSESSDVVGSFLGKMAKLKGILPASVTDDKILSKLFPHTYLPHYVWINGTGKVVAITGGPEVTESNVRAVLEGKDLNLMVKKDQPYKIVNATFPDGKPLFFPGVSVRSEESGNTVTLSKVADESMVIHSSLTRYLEGIGGSGMNMDSTRFTFWNAPVMSLYQAVLWRFGPQVFNRSTVVIDIKDTSISNRLITQTRNLEYISWLRENGYCYEIKVHPSLASKKYDIALDELNRYFGVLYGIEGVLEKREVQYLALVRTTQEDKLKSKGEKPSLKYNAYSAKITNNSLSNLLFVLAKPLQFQPIVIDETGYTQKVDIELNCDLSNLQSLNTELARYDLQLVPKSKMSEVAVIRMKK